MANFTVTVTDPPSSSATFTVFVEDTIGPVYIFRAGVWVPALSYRRSSGVWNTVDEATNTP